MIKLLKDGSYSLAETKERTKILTLDNAQFAWVDTTNAGEILVVSSSTQKIDRLLAASKYRLYAVDDEPKLVDQQHLEMHVGGKKWQGYLLPTGLPAGKKKRAKIIASREIISSPKDLD